MKSLFFAVFLFFILSTAAQEYNFKRFSTEDGLSLSQIAAIKQHPNGTLIIGTYGGGIDFYDGTSFQNISVNDGLSSNLVYSLALDKENTLWIGTGKGLDSYSSNGSIRNNLFKELQENVIWNFLYEDNKLWICSEKGLYLLENDSLTTIYKNIRTYGAVKTDSTILLATNKGLLSLRNDNSYITVDQFKKEFILTIIKTKDNRIILGTDKGLIVYKNDYVKRYTTEDGLINNEVYTLFQDSKERIWIGTEKGLDQFRDGKFYGFKRSTGINEYRIWKIFEARDKALWFAADDGLYYLLDDNFKLYRNYNNIPLDVWAINKVNNKIVFGTHQQGILEFDDYKLSTYYNGKELEGKIVRSLLVNKKQDELLIGTDKGLFKQNLKSKKIESIEFPDDALRYDFISMFQDSKNNTWLSTIFNGTYKINPNQKLSNYLKVDSASLSSVYKIQEGKSANLWFGTENGIIRYSNDKFLIPENLKNLFHQEIVSLRIQDERTLWAGIYGYGVVQIDISNPDEPFVARRISTEDGLNDNSVLALVLDNNKLWVGTNFGLNLIDFEKLNSGESFIRSFTKYDGFPGLEFVQNSIYKESDHSIWYGTIKGIVNFDPTRINVNDDALNVYISKFVVKNQDNELSYVKNPLASSFLDEEIVLDHKQNNITIEFKSISFPSAENVEYQYRMGEKDSWSPISTDHSVNFYNLPPKDYSFEVRAIKDGSVSKNYAAIKFSIAAPFWLSSWFYLTIIVVVLLIAYIGYIYRVNLLNAKNKELQRRIEERKKYQEQLEIWQKELIAAKDLAEKSDRLKSEFLAQMSHEIRTPINSILNFSYLLKEGLAHQVDEDLKEAFSIIDRGGKRLIRTIDSILNMSQIQVGSFETRIEKLNISDVVEGLYLEFKQSIEDKGLRFEIIEKAKSSIVYADEYTSTQIFANLIDNAFKYTPQGEIKIKIFNPDDVHLAVSVQDTGIGISEAKIDTVFHPFSQEESGYTRKFEGVGLGLALVKNYCELNDAEIKVESKKGAGTTFTVTYKLSH